MVVLDKILGDIPGAFYGIISKFVEIINGVLVSVSGPFAVYVVAMLSLIIAYFIRRGVQAGQSDYVWYAILAFLTFFSLRYLGISS